QCVKSGRRETLGERNQSGVHRTAEAVRQHHAGCAGCAGERIAARGVVQTATGDAGAGKLYFARLIGRALTVWSLHCGPLYTPVRGHLSTADASRPSMNGGRKYRPEQTPPRSTDAPPAPPRAPRAQGAGPAQPTET